MNRLLFTASLALFLQLSSVANAHFVWVVQNGETVQVHFSESAQSLEPELLKNVSTASVWSVVSGTQGGVKFLEIPLTLSEASLSGMMDPKSNAVVLSHNYGVVTKGDLTFLLKYLAKQHVSPLPGQWSAINDAEHLPLEITPSWSSRQLVLKVTWQGKPAAGIEVNVGGCGLENSLTTDPAGTVRCEPTTDGVLSVRAIMMEAEKGELNGEAYGAIRTYSTLTLPVIRPAMEVDPQRLAALPQGITSFGAAIVGTELYVYGGHFGDAHHYSDSGQSGELLQISLTAENAEWQSLAGGPKLTGLAMVEHGGKLYRIGRIYRKEQRRRGPKPLVAG